jgi:hypothetical protein
MATQTQTAKHPVSWGNPFSHVPVVAAKRTESSPQWLKDLDEKGVSRLSTRKNEILMELVGCHPKGHLAREGRTLRQ